jgi:UDP:flavonoid glycosyltransferase YjiC (YdhE family)
VAKRIVISTIGSYGDLHPYIAVGRGLRARGHEVLIATSARYAANVERAGLKFQAVFPDFADLGDEEEIVRRVYHPRRGAEALVREVILPHLARTFDDLTAGMCYGFPRSSCRCCSCRFTIPRAWPRFRG